MELAETNKELIEEEIANALTHELAASEEVRSSRMDVCNSCDQKSTVYDLDFCNSCACFIKLISYHTTQTCPKGKW